ncbi:NAD(P)-binding protein [Aspergillus sclerotioniger CBS 115572]|uniref:NAD(P)-binding protein n=1 Tax=Aspergillus sclerotioniger CBS 115572 TaxID=1450535 RepID=A0A317X6X6_9EURO|nr:NAD(P)-binding protein [Aspergillus sclerotioniger CBS 115572]PWY93392.1 NAD(P)-binding protein [Aspergillus sclerotioniger CBS 115572]
MPTVLITGANKGIGLTLLKTYLTRPQTTVIAAIRNPNTQSPLLLTLPTAPSSRLLIVQIDSTSNTDAPTAITSLLEQGITSLDIVIANAGIVDPSAFVPVADINIAQLQEHLDINTVGPVRLFQATLPLLRRSPRGRFVVMSSLMGTIAGMGDVAIPIAAYGASKAAVNFFTRKMHFENERVATLVVHPGSVKTDSGNDAARAVGYPGAFVEIEDSVKAVVEKIDTLSKENGSGEFWGFDGSVIAW